MTYPKSLTPIYYLRTNPDVAASSKYGSPGGAKAHYDKYGKKEGRSPNVFFDPLYYQAKQNDVRQFFGDNQWEQFFKHWLKYGFREGRRGGPLFDPAFYLKEHSDLTNAFGATNYEKAYEHWLAHGIQEGRRSVPEVNGPLLNPAQAFRLTDETHTILQTSAIIGGATRVAKWVKDNWSTIERIGNGLMLGEWLIGKIPEKQPEPTDPHIKELQDWFNDPNKEAIILEPGSDPFPNIA